MGWPWSQDHLGVRRALVDVVHAQPVGQLGPARREREAGQVKEAFLGVRMICTASWCRTAGTEGAGLLDSMRAGT